MRRMGAVKCSASHQLVRALTTSAMIRIVSEMAGKLSAPKMLGRRGVNNTVYTAPSAPMICGGARPIEPKRRNAFSGGRLPRMSWPSGPKTKSSRSPGEFRLRSSQPFNAPIPPRARISEAWMASDGRRCNSIGSLSREAIVKVVAMLLPTMSVIANRNSKNILRKRLCMRPGKGVTRSADVLDLGILADLEIELTAQITDVGVDAAIIGGKLAAQCLLGHGVP